MNESTTSLCNIVEKYKDGLHQLSVETTSLGQFLRDCGKNSVSSESVMCNSGKVICYLGTQHYSAMSSLTRTLQELNTFKRAVNDTKETITVMEKERTEYRSALALMKTCSTDIDPDSGRGLEKFRTSQKYVKFAKQKFDKYSLACLQKVENLNLKCIFYHIYIPFQIDLLAAARCNLFSYSLASYQTNWHQLNQKNEEVLEAHIKLIEKEPKKHNFGILKDIAAEVEENEQTNEKQNEPGKMEVDDKDQQLFFGDEFSDAAPATSKSGESKASESSEKLIDYERDFDDLLSSSNILLPSQLLMDDSLFNNDASIDLLGSLMTSQAEQDQTSDLLSPGKENTAQLNKNPSKKSSDVSKWFSLFSELDPFNQQLEQYNASKNLHAA